MAHVYYTGNIFIAQAPSSCLREKRFMFFSSHYQLSLKALTMFNHQSSMEQPPTKKRQNRMGALPFGGFALRIQKVSSYFY
jgi:hypothetical protein